MNEGTVLYIIFISHHIYHVNSHWIIEL